MITENSGEIRFIDDVSMSTDVIVHMTNRVVQRDTYTPTNLGWTFEGVRNAIITDEREVIKSVECVRVDFPANGGEDLGNAWLSQSIGIVMRDHNPSQGWMWEVTDIQFREPEPGTFAVPEGFREVDE